MKIQLSPEIKAQAIAAAIYTATGIPANVITGPGARPLVTVTKADAEKLRAFLWAAARKKSDVQLDLKTILKPIILKDILPAFGASLIAAAAIGYFLKK